MHNIDYSSLKLWSFMPQIKHTERLSWKTDIIQTKRLEQRIAVRSSPRQTLTYTSYLTQQQMADAKQLLVSSIDSLIAVPIWNQSTQLSSLQAGATQVLIDTSYADYRDSTSALVWSDTLSFEVIDIDLVLSDRLTLTRPTSIPHGMCYVMPVRAGYALKGATFSRDASDNVKVAITFNIQDNTLIEANLSQHTYKQQLVLTDRLVLNGGLTDAVKPELYTLDTDTGVVAIRSKYEYVKQTSQLTQDTLDRESRWRMYSVLHSLKGKQKSFWLPTWADEFKVITTNTNSIVVQPLEFAQNYVNMSIMVKLKDNNYMFNTIESVSTDSQSMTINFESALSNSVTLQDIDTICVINNVRLASDDVTLNHSYDARAYTKINIETAPELIDV